MAAAVRARSRQKPHVLVLDLRMPAGASSIETIGQLRELAPDTQVVVLTMEDNPVFAQHALAAGALGFVLKDPPTASWEQAVRAAARGESTSARGSPPDRSWRSVTDELTARGRGPATDRARPHERRNRRQLDLTAHGSPGPAFTASSACTRANWWVRAGTQPAQRELGRTCSEPERAPADEALTTRAVLSS